jgi:hypothetical protein
LIPSFFSSVILIYLWNMDLKKLVIGLADLGVPTHLVQGVDWGYGRDLQRERTGKVSMWFTEQAVWRLRQAGMLLPVVVEGARMFSLCARFHDTWQGCYAMRFTLDRVNASAPLYKLCGSCGDSGFGHWSLKYQMRARTVAMFQRRIEEKLGKISC